MPEVDVVQKAPKDIGIDKIHVAKLTGDVLGANAPTYGKPLWVPEAINIKLSPQNFAEKFFSDNRQSENFSGTTSLQIAMTIAGASRNTRRAILGLDPIDENQKYETRSFKEDPGYVAFGYRRKINGKVNGRQKYRYVWIFKAIFVPPDENSDTQTDKTSVTPGQYSGEALSLDCFEGTEREGDYCLVMDNWEAGVTKDDEADFFNQVIISKDASHQEPEPEPEPES